MDDIKFPDGSDIPSDWKFDLSKCTHDGILNCEECLKSFAYLLRYAPERIISEETLVRATEEESKAKYASLLKRFREERGIQDA